MGSACFRVPAACVQAFQDSQHWRSSAKAANDSGKASVSATSSKEATPPMKVTSETRSTQCSPMPSPPIHRHEERKSATSSGSHFKEMALPKLTHPAPDFSGTAVVGGQFKDIKLSDYKGKYLVLFFYPLDFTFVCPTEIIAFSDHVEEFRKINCEVVACSTDSHFCHLAWINTSRKEGGLGNMNIPLLADKTCKISRDYGVLKEDEGIPFRGLFIIDDKGRLRQMTINDLPVGRSVDETLRLVQAFQYTDKHGEVCPANWKPGGDTMKPDPKGSKDYFSKH